MPYLIDGNNLLGSWGGPALAGDGRLEVVRRVAEFCRTRGARATIVFDGAPLRPDQGDQRLDPVTLRFPPAGGDADSVIREIIDRTPRPAELVVVSSDKALYSYARTRGASALRAREWTALSRGAVAGRRRSARAVTSEKPERETDVEGWLRRFSRR
jgi:predicted RNA-binding protein with PIN domain